MRAARDLIRETGDTNLSMRMIAQRAEVIKLLPESSARRFKALALEDKGDMVLVALGDPLDLFAYDELKRLLKSIQESDPAFDLELTGFAEDEIRKLFDAEDPAEDLEIIPRMECQAFEHHDYLVFMFHDLRDWMQVLQLMGVREVNYSITRTTKKLGIGRVLYGKRLLDLCKRAALAGTPTIEPAPGHHEPQPPAVDHQPPPVSECNARRSRKRAG